MSFDRAKSAAVSFLGDGRLLIAHLCTAATLSNRRPLGPVPPPVVIRYGVTTITCVPTLVALIGKTKTFSVETTTGNRWPNTLNNLVLWLGFVLILKLAFPYLCQSLHGLGWSRSSSIIREEIRPQERYSCDREAKVLFLTKCTSQQADRDHSTLVLSKSHYSSFSAALVSCSSGTVSSEHTRASTLSSQ